MVFVGLRGEGIVKQLINYTRHTTHFNDFFKGNENAHL